MPWVTITGLLHSITYFRINAYATLPRMKALIWLGITIGGGVGGWLGSLLDNSNLLGMWSILFGVIGSLVGIWTAYRYGQ